MHGKCVEGTCSAPALSCQRLAHPLVGLRGFEPLHQYISQVGRQVDFQMSSDDDVCVANLLGEGVRVRVARRELLHLAQLEEKGDIFGREFGLRVLQQIIAAKVVLEHFILRGSGSQRATISGLLDHCQGVQVRLGARVEYTRWRSQVAWRPPLSSLLQDHTVECPRALAPAARESHVASRLWHVGLVQSRGHGPGLVTCVSVADYQRSPSRHCSPVRRSLL